MMSKTRNVKLVALEKKYIFKDFENYSTWVTLKDIC